MLDSTLERLEGENWGEPNDPKDAPTPLIQKCLRLRRVPLRELTVENLRMLVRQEIGVEHLMPLALERLDQESSSDAQLLRAIATFLGV